jgi:hypothetical protein
MHGNSMSSFRSLSIPPSPWMAKSREQESQTFASWAAIRGVSIYKISEWLGHSTVQLTQDTYAHLQSYDADIDRF